MSFFQFIRFSFIKIFENQIPITPTCADTLRAKCPCHYHEALSLYLDHEFVEIYVKRKEFGIEKPKINLLHLFFHFKCSSIFSIFFTKSLYKFLIQNKLNWVIHPVTNHLSIPLSHLVARVTVVPRGRYNASQISHKWTLH